MSSTNTEADSDCQHYFDLDSGRAALSQCCCLPSSRVVLFGFVLFPTDGEFEHSSEEEEENDGDEGEGEPPPRGVRRERSGDKRTRSGKMTYIEENWPAEEPPRTFLCSNCTCPEGVWVCGIADCECA